MIYIGIDTGVNTGVAVWDNRQRTFLQIETMKIHKAMELVKDYKLRAATDHTKLVVRVEDARKRTWYGYNDPKKDRDKLQGAGSVKRDCKIWEDFLADYTVEFQMVAPKNNATKMNAESFKKLTGWKKSTNEHNRDAAMLVFGF